MKRRKRDLGPDLFVGRCPDCDRILVVTESGFLCCPAGHGKLVIDQRDDCPADVPQGLFEEGRDE